MAVQPFSIAKRVLFGRKADQATLHEFVELAAHLEMGLTSPGRPDEGTIAGAPFPPGTDPAPDPELTEVEVALLTDFIRYLAPPARRMGESVRDRRMIERGEELFGTIGCAACHTPYFTTGPSAVPALDREIRRSDVSPPASRFIGGLFAQPRS